MARRYQVLLVLMLAMGCGLGEATVEGPRSQPPPPAAAAEPDQILQWRAADCEVNCRPMETEYEECVAMVCADGPVPLLEIRAVDSPKSPGDEVEILGTFGRQEAGLSVALAEGRDGRLYHRHPVAVLSWENQRIVGMIYPVVPEDGYQLLIVYQVNLGARALPIYMQNSNAVPIAIRSP